MRGLKKSCSSDEVCVEPDEDSQHQDIQLGGTLPVHLLVLFVLEHDGVGGQETIKQYRVARSHHSSTIVRSFPGTFLVSPLKNSRSSSRPRRS